MGVAISGTSQSSLQIEINGLGKPANQYYNFRAVLYQGSTFITSINWTSSGTGNLTRNTFYGLSSGTSYSINCYVQSLASSSEIFWGTAYGTTDSPSLPVPTTPSYASLSTVANNPNQLTASWGSSSYATEYDIYLYCNGSFYNSYVSYSTSYTFSGLATGYDWYYVVHGYNSSGSSGGRTSNTVKTEAPDTIAPTIIYQSATGIGLLRLGWTAYDNTGGSGISYYRTYVGTPGGDESTLVAKDTLSAGATFAEWTADANGATLKVDSYYWVGVRVYDAKGNSSLLTYRIQFKRVRPADWSWGLSMTTGQPVNMTAAKWNEFTTRINQFRFYKGLTDYNFTTVVSGTRMMASQVNQATNAINAMNPSSPPPSIVSSGVAITPVRFTLLRDSLNSIT